MAAAMGEFDSWLSNKLLNISADVDTVVFVDYIKGILDDNETTSDEQREYIVDFLGQISEDGLEDHCSEIIEAYNEKNGAGTKESEAKLTFDEQIASALEKNKAQVIGEKRSNNKPVTKEEEERRKAKLAILQQYEQVCEGQESSDEGDEVSHENGDVPSLVKNVNTQLVIDRQQAEREQNKAMYEKKKQKDREDRDKQKQKVEERKNAEKKRTQKGEKRR